MSPVRPEQKSQCAVPGLAPASDWPDWPQQSTPQSTPMRAESVAQRDNSLPLHCPKEAEWCASLYFDQGGLFPSGGKLYPFPPVPDSYSRRKPIFQSRFENEIPASPLYWSALASRFH